MFARAWSDISLFFQSRPFDALTIVGFVLMIAGALVIARSAFSDNRLGRDRAAAKESFGSLLT